VGFKYLQLGWLAVSPFERTDNSNMMTSSDELPHQVGIDATLFDVECFE
jgi:hypothetical protein